MRRPRRGLVHSWVESGKGSSRRIEQSAIADCSMLGRMSLLKIVTP
jgi:hypothetical protein